MDGFNDDDRRAAIATEARIAAMAAQLEQLERTQLAALRRIRRLPDLTAAAIVAAVSKRALFLIGLGIAVGSALGGAGVEVARKAAMALMGAR